MATAEELVAVLQLEPHPGGCNVWFRQTHQSPATVVCRQCWINDKLRISVENNCFVCRDGEGRQASTTILSLRKFGAAASWQQMLSDETVHFHCGATLSVYWILNDGELVQTKLGLDIAGTLLEI